MKSFFFFLYTIIALPTTIAIFAIFTGTFVEIIKYSFSLGSDFGNTIINAL